MKIIIRPELSAQGINKNGNPMVTKSIPLILDYQGNNSVGTVVDQGCGQLRHVDTLLRLSRRLVLVDTEYQLSTPHDFDGNKLTIPEYVRKRWPRKNIDIITNTKFQQGIVHSDVIFSINVLDVTSRNTRKNIAQAARLNLASNGLFVLIVPRNDSWTLKICTSSNHYQDGYIFTHSRGYTYYHNWSGDSLEKWINKFGFKVVYNLSTYRQAALICKLAKDN